MELNGTLAIAILIITILINNAIFEFLKKKKKTSVSILNSFSKNNEEMKTNDFTFSQNDVDTFIHYLSPEDELGQYIIICLKPGQTLKEAKESLFNSDNLRDIISMKLQMGNIFVDKEDSVLTLNQINDYMGTVTLNDELGQYIAASLKEGVTISTTTENLFDSNHIKMIITNKLSDLLNSIGTKRKEKKIVITNIDEYIRSEIMICTPKSTITTNLLNNGYTFNDIYSAINIVEGNIVEGTEDKVIIKSPPKKIKTKPKVIDKRKQQIIDYLLMRKNADGNFAFARKRLFEVGHNKDYIESLIKELNS